MVNHRKRGHKEEKNLSFQNKTFEEAIETVRSSIEDMEESEMKKKDFQDKKGNKDSKIVEQVTKN